MPSPIRPPLHVLPYGDFGSGKSTFAATFPHPQLIFMWDAFGKDMPYLNSPLHTVGDLQIDGYGGKYREVISRKTGAVLKRLEYYHDTQWTEANIFQRKAGKSVHDIIPNAYARWLKRMANLEGELAGWRTIINDSTTMMEIAARRWDQYVLNPGAEDGRQWYGASKDMLEKALMGRLAGLSINVVVICHIDDEKYESQGVARRMPMAPGKLRASLPSQYGEVYRQFVAPDGSHWLQSRSDALWAATTQIDCPNPCLPHYAALWANLDAKAAAPTAASL